MKHHWNMVLALVILSAALGYFGIFHATEFKSLERNVASISDKKLFSFNQSRSDVFTGDLSKKIKISTMLEKKEKIISLTGFSSQLCQSYDKIELTFEAYGVSVAGEPPLLKVTADCLPAQDPSEIALIKIPYELLFKEKSRNAEFNFSGYASQFTSVNSDVHWSKTWILSQILFKSASSTKMVLADKLSQEKSVVLEF